MHEHYLIATILAKEISIRTKGLDDQIYQAFINQVVTVKGEQNHLVHFCIQRKFVGTSLKSAEG